MTDEAILMMYSYWRRSVSKRLFTGFRTKSRMARVTIILLDPGSEVCPELSNDWSDNRYGPRAQG